MVTPTRALAATLAGLVFAPAALPSLRPSVLAAQEAPPVRAHLMGNPVPGRDAPAFSLPYVTRDGPGPSDQPFVLRAELGRVVVLAFCPAESDSATAELLRTFAARADQLFIGDVVVAAVVAAGMEGATRLATDMSLPYKVLPDQHEDVRRLFGVDRGSLGLYVIGLDGRVRWRDTRFNPFLATGYERLRQAVTAATLR